MGRGRTSGIALGTFFPLFMYNGEYAFLLLFDMKALEL